MPRPSHLLLVATCLLPLLAGCPAANAPPCETDTDCGDGARCRFGGCGPICVADDDCGTQQVCTAGRCTAPPECATDAQCAEGFTCTKGACACSTDAACAANQACVDGRCEGRERCTDDTPCLPLGRRCEVTQGLCVPPCSLPSDCAPGVDPQVATALFACQGGTCVRRCLGDPTCGTGLICDEGFCEAAACKTYADCPSGSYCSSARFGRCEQEVRCTDDTACGANQRCGPFPADACPPGFPCEQSICRELPRCLSDPDCAGAPAYCGDQHCQPTTACQFEAGCTAGMSCVAGLCVPGACRGDADCAAPSDAGPGASCVDGQCMATPTPSQVASLQLFPSRAWAVVGDEVHFKLVGYLAGGQAVPLPSATFLAVDPPDGGTSTAAHVGADGVLTADAPGEMVVRAAYTPAGGGGALPREARVTVVSPPASGKTVLVLDARREPVVDAEVVGCDAPPTAATCGAPVTVRTDASGAAHFPSFSGATASFTASPGEVLDGGVPLLERASLIDASGTLFFLPLGGERATSASGFRGSTSFTSVHGSGTVWAGLTLVSSGDPADLDLGDVVGEPFQATVPGVGQSIPVPSNVVAFTAAAFGVPTKIKDTAYGTGVAGRRVAVAFAGKVDGTQLLGVRSVDLLAALGGLDVGMQGPVALEQLQRVEDVGDLDRDGLCPEVQDCPAGTEQRPDYARLAQLSLSPSRVQALRTEVVLPSLPQGLDTAVVVAAQAHPEAGLIPLGLGSRTGGAPTADGSRPMDPLTLRSAPAWSVATVGRPAIWVHALSVNPQGAQVGRAAAGVISVDRAAARPRLPEQVTVSAFLPLATGGALAAGIFTPGAGPWSAGHGAGARLARVVVKGAAGRHVLWLPVEPGRTAYPLLGSTLGDPVLEAGRTVEVQLLQLDGVQDGRAPLDASAPSLLDLPALLVRYSRSPQ